MKIDATTTDEERPYLNLMPILEALEDDGNKAIEGGFVINPDGWRCLLRDPIDFALLEASFELPPNVVLIPARDTVLDRASWCSIEGSNASVD
jgi:hypothetical protein